jgi:rod shape-determining protein MreD
VINIQDGLANIPRMIIIGIIALLAQLIVAPNIRVANATPDLILIVTVVQAVRVRQTAATVFGFSMGFLLDLVSTGPFGLMTLILTVLSLVVSSINKGSFTDHIFVEIGLVILAAMFGELLYGVVQALVNPDIDFMGSLLFIVLPTFAYDAILALLVVFITHLFGGQVVDATGYGNTLNVGGRHSARNLNNSKLGNSKLGYSKLGSGKLGNSRLGSSRFSGGSSKLPGRSIRRKLK